jgi:Domain of unknown function (DUF4184)
MPFTVSHIAAVLPGYRPLTRAHVFMAAVIGSMVPDFGLLLPNTLVRWQSHSVSALFSFCLPVGLFAYWLTLLLIKPALQEVAPDRAYLRLRARHPSVAISNPMHWLYAALALLLGAASHLLWDDFTHEDARGVRMFPVLSGYEPEMAGHSLQLYRWLQYGSSIFGLAVLAAALTLWWRHAPAATERPQRRIAPGERAAWSSLYLLVPLLAIFWLFSESHGSVGDEIRSIAVGSMRGAAVSLLLISALIRIRLAARY